MTTETTETVATNQQHVLVAVDFSADSARAVLWACDYAELKKLPLTVLHVIHDPADAPGYYKTDEKDLLKPIQDIARKRLETFLQELRDNMPDNSALANAETVLVQGLPPTRILEVAKRIEATLIVMGSRGRSGLASIILGSKAQRVVQLSKIPVAIIKAPEEKDKD